ncbi:hypothetical protein [Streptomyces lunalinharesii]|uniref:Uncharacterized protein n=1 Tax=Streptomyces lunalinharesii TaxID=333384 RepID=A0ABN3R407_9ACTN
MKSPLCLGVVSTTLLSATAVMPVVPATDQRIRRADKPVPTLDIKVDEQAGAEARQIIESNTPAATGFADASRSKYTISTGAARYGTYGTTYTWSDGTTTGPSLYDGPNCTVFFDDISPSGHTGVRLRSSHLAEAAKEDRCVCTKPMHQNRGYRGKTYPYLESSSGSALVDNIRTVRSGN